MPPTHRKITRKELKQPDEFQSVVESAQEFLQNNLRQVVISVVIVAIAGAIAIGTWSYETHRDRMAGEAFYGALTALQNKQYTAAQTEFTKLSINEPNRRVGKLARLYLAEAYIGENQFAKARDALIAFVSEYHDPEFSSIALNDLGVVYERMGDLKKAAGAYHQAANIPGPARDGAALSAARVEAKLGDKQAAIQSYRDFLAQHPYSQQRTVVVESLAMLGVSPESMSRGAAQAPASGPMPVVISTPGAARSAPTAKH